VSIRTQQSLYICTDIQCFAKHCMYRPTMFRETLYVRTLNDLCKFIPGHKTFRMQSTVAPSSTSSSATIAPARAAVVSKCMECFGNIDTCAHRSFAGEDWSCVCIICKKPGVLCELCKDPRTGPHDGVRGYHGQDPTSTMPGIVQLTGWTIPLYGHPRCLTGVEPGSFRDGKYYE